MNPNVQAAMTATKKKVPSKPKGKNASSTGLDSTAMKSGQPSLGDKPAASEMSITQYVFRCCNRLLSTMSL